MRTANGIGFDKVYLVDLFCHGGKPPKMNRKKIFMSRAPHDMFELVTRKQFINDILPLYDGVSMELTDDAVDLTDYTWKQNPLIIVGPENGNVPDEILKLTEQVKVPMGGVVKCFNVACAASIAMWDCVTK